MRNIRLHRFFFVILFSWLCVGLITACASNNRASHITSIGHEDLTSEKSINIIIYQDKNNVNLEASDVFERNAQRVIVNLKNLNTAKKSA